MKKKFKIILTLTGAFVFSSCSIKQMAFKSAANAMAPIPEYKIKIKPDPDAPNPLTAITGEDDIELVGEVFPLILKLYEAMHIQDPNHRGLAIMTGRLYITYSNVFVESPAVYLSDDQFDKKNTALLRAKKFYLRGARLALSSLDTAYPGFAEAMLSEKEDIISMFLKKCKNYDAEALHWAAAGFLAAFALEPLNSEISGVVPGARSMLERVCAMDPAYSEGAVWEILAKFYAAAPDFLGGGKQKAEDAYKNALKFSKGKSPSVYVTYAMSFCVPNQDSKGFDEALTKALAINPDMYPADRLAITLSQNYARWLKTNKENFILGE